MLRRDAVFPQHVASNPYTRYRPFPTPAQFAASEDAIKRATVWLRRELRVWPNLEIEVRAPFFAQRAAEEAHVPVDDNALKFLITFIISLMKSLDVRSESAIKLIAEFLDMDTNSRTFAEHFAHGSCFAFIPCFGIND